jgi:hypothetical protein
MATMITCGWLIPFMDGAHDSKNEALLSQLLGKKKNKPNISHNMV